MRQRNKNKWEIYFWPFFSFTWLKNWRKTTVTEFSHSNNDLNLSFKLILFLGHPVSFKQTLASLLPIFQLLFSAIPQKEEEKLMETLHPRSLLHFSRFSNASQGIFRPWRPFLESRGLDLWKALLRHNFHVNDREWLRWSSSQTFVTRLRKNNSLLYIKSFNGNYSF